MCVFFAIGSNPKPTMGRHMAVELHKLEDTGKALEAVNGRLRGKDVPVEGGFMGKGVALVLLVGFVSEGESD